MNVRKSSQVEMWIFIFLSLSLKLHAQDINYPKAIEKFVKIFPREHISKMCIDDVISARAWTNYLLSLDFEHIYFLSSDIQKFEDYKYKLDDQLIKGDLSFAFAVYSVFKERLRNRIAFVENFFSSPPDLTIQEKFKWKRNKANWPSADEWDELWRKKIKNEYIQSVVSKSLVNSSTNKNNEETIDAQLDSDSLIIKRYKQTLLTIEDSGSDWVFQKYMSAFAQSYDPHSDYMSPSEEEDFNIEMKLSLEGIGAVLRSEEGAAQVVSLVPGGPAAKDTSPERLVPGDKIIAVGQDDKEPISILHWPLSKIVNLIRGPKGTKVTLIVIPASDPSGSSTKQLTLIREEVKLEEQAATSSVARVKSPDGTIRRLGIITLPAFYADMESSFRNRDKIRNSASDVRKLLINLKSQKIKGLLLDLRNNGGGSLIDAVEITGFFIPSGPVVQVVERDIRIYSDPDPTIIYDGPMVVLVNRLSASASEILASALQDYGRAVIIGDSRTHGKGTVQTIVNLSEKEKLGSIRVTTAIYYRISGKSTQPRGVIPDIIIPSPLDNLELGEDYLPNALTCPPIASTRYEPNKQLPTIIEKLKEMSWSRRSTNSEFVSYVSLINSISNIYNNEEIPLDIASRTELFKVERELLEKQQKISPPDIYAPPDGKNKPMDPVLRESLEILNDLVTIYEKSSVEPINKGKSKNQIWIWMEKIKKWLKEKY